MPADDVFQCPECGQKHRGDLASVRAGGTGRARCALCGKSLLVEWRDGRVAVRIAATDGAPAAPAAGSPTPVPRPETPAPARQDTPVPPTAAAASRGREPRAASVAPRRRGAAKEKEEREPVAPSEGEALEAEYPPGTKVGRYSLEVGIGQGGTGTVYRAFDVTTNRYVALKALRPDQSEAIRAGFLREIEVQANLRHPNLMPVFDRGEHEGNPYFTMELLYRPFTLTQIVTMAKDGSLSRYATLRPLERLETLLETVFVPVCEGVHVANVENGVLHRDIKPDNVLVDSRTLRPYVIDFGNCTLLERKTPTGRVTVPPTAEDAGIVGTPRFLAPEQARGAVHERTDVWGLGATLYFCVTGEPPIAPAAGIGRAELRRRIEALRAAEQAAREAGDEAKAELCGEKLSRMEDSGLRTLDDLFQDAREGRYVPLPAGTPAALAAIVRKAMATKTVERYANARSLAADVRAWLAGAPTRAGAEQGSSAAAVVQNVQSALKRHLVTGIAVLAVGALAFFAGRTLSGATAGGGARRATAILADLDALDRRAEGLGRAASAFTPREAARLYDLLHAEAESAGRAAAALPEGSEKDAVTARLGYVGDRFAAPQGRIEAPRGVTTALVEDVARGTPAKEVAVGDVVLAPGEYRLTLGSSHGVRIPLVVPFAFREGGQASRREPPRWKVVVPVAPDAVPARMVLVVPGSDTVEHRGPPWSPPVAVPAPIAPFLMDRFEVSNADWEAYLEAIPDDAERKRRVPSLEFVPDPERPGRFVVPRPESGPGARDLPVRGVSPEDAVAYAAWRSQRDHATVRLPTEAEWVVAAGALLHYDLPCGARGVPEEGDFAAPVPVEKARDLSPYGVVGLLGNVREIVTAVRADEGSADRFLVKGAGPGDEPAAASLRLVRPLAPDARDARTGFRCVRVIP